MSLTDVKYKRNQTILSLLGCGDNIRIKLTTLACLRTAGIEDDCKKQSEKGSVNDSKLDNNISRTKQKIFELAFCNPWELFGTFTLDPSKFDRTDLKGFNKKFSQYLRNLGKKYNSQIKYLLIPELHKDNQCWHMHGFLYGLPYELLDQFRIGDTMGKQIAVQVKKGATIYNWLGYQNKFGFCSLEPIKSQEAVSKYITKYITKDLLQSVTELNSHSYYASQGLKTKTNYKKGTLTIPIEYDFENEYCSIVTLRYTDELFNYLMESIDTEYC